MIAHVVALSGGKDSTALALRLRELSPDIPYQFVCTPTGDELPDMQAHWDRLEEKLGKIIKLPVLTLYELIEEQKMIPNHRARFCTRVLKIEPFLQYMDTLPSDSVMYVGLRADEETRVGAVIQPSANFSVSTPFREWGWGLKDVKEYLAGNGIEIPKRTDCGACFFQRLEEWRDLLKSYPERYERYVQIEKKIGHTFRSPSRDTWPASLAELREEFEKGRKLRQRRVTDPDKLACPWCSK